MKELRRKSVAVIQAVPWTTRVSLVIAPPTAAGAAAGAYPIPAALKDAALAWDAPVEIVVWVGHFLRVSIVWAIAPQHVMMHRARRYVLHMALRLGFVPTIVTVLAIAKGAVCYRMSIVPVSTSAVVRGKNGLNTFTAVEI